MRSDPGSERMVPGPWDSLGKAHMERKGLVTGAEYRAAKERDAAIRSGISGRQGAVRSTLHVGVGNVGRRTRHRSHLHSVAD